MDKKHIVRYLGLCASSLVALALAGCDSGGGGGGGNTTTTAGSGSPTSSGTSSGSPTSTGTGGSVGGPFVNAGYISAGSWSGYGYTVADTLGEGTTVSPVCSGTGDAGTCTPPFTGDTFCMTGSVAPDPGYAGFALLGWNLAQDQTTSVISSWTVPATGGVTITLTNPDTAPLRLQVEIPNAATSADRYCATLVSGQELKWSDLETVCYDSTGNVPLAAGTKLQNAAVQVYGGNMAAVPFNVCITGMTVQ